MVVATGIDVPMKRIEAFCQRFGVEELALFGSILREDFGPDSDVDIMLKFRPGHGFTFENTPEIQDELESIFGRRVDVIEMGRIRNPIRRRAAGRDRRRGGAGDFRGIQSRASADPMAADHGAPPSARPRVRRDR